MTSADNFSVMKLLDKLIDVDFIKGECKFSISITELNIENSMILGKPGGKFETFLFLPESETRKAEGGLRTKGYLKHSYKLFGKDWYICDFEGNPLKVAPLEIQQRINQYLNSVSYGLEIRELPLISVITVVLNGEKYLEQAIQSVINQTYPNIEYIIIDGGSTDGTLDIIRRYEDYIDYWVSEKDNGIYDAMNKGIKLALGQWIGILNSDDRYFSRDLFEKIFVKSRLSNCDVIYGDTLILEEFNRENSYILRPKRLSKLKYTMAFGHLSAFVSIKVYKTVGLYDIKYKVASDFNFFQRIYLMGYRFCYFSEAIGVLRAHPKSTSFKEIYKGLYENFLISVKNGQPFFKQFFIFIIRLLNTFIKRKIPFLKTLYSFGTEIRKVRD